MRLPIGLLIIYFLSFPVGWLLAFYPLESIASFLVLGRLLTMWLYRNEPARWAEFKYQMRDK